MNLSMIILLVSVVIASFSQMLLKKSASKNYDNLIKEYCNPYVICGYGMMFLSMFLTIISYKGLEFTNVPLVESLGYIFVLILSVIFFKEKITKHKVIGMMLILIGILVYYI